MTNLTPIVSDILVQKHTTKAISEHQNTSEILDAFLQEAYQINTNITSLLTYLRNIRQPYLSTAPPPRRTNTRLSQSHTTTHLTDAEREEIDASTSHLLRDLNGNITNLSSAASIKSDTDTQLLEHKYGKPNHSGILWRWAAGEGDAPDAGKPQEQIDDEGRLRTLKIFREGVLWYLSVQLSLAAGRQQEMVTIRLEREREKERSVLYKTKTAQISIDSNAEQNGNGSLSPYGNMDLRGRSYDPAFDKAQDKEIEAQLTPEQLQLFESENSTLLNHYNDTLSKVTQAEKSLLEISSLQQTLVGHLTTQGEMVEQLVVDAENTDENVRRGNRELKKASERGSTAKGVFWVTLGLCGFLVGWDLVF